MSPATSKLNFPAPFSPGNLHFIKCHIIIRFWYRFEIMKYSSQFLKLLVLSACLCSREGKWMWLPQPPGTGLLLADREQNWMSSSPLKALNKGLMISCLLQSVLLNSLWMEIYSKSDLAMPDGLKLTMLSSHPPGSHSLETLVCVWQKAYWPWKNGQ